VAAGWPVPTMEGAGTEFDGAAPRRQSGSTEPSRLFSRSRGKRRGRAEQRAVPRGAWFPQGRGQGQRQRVALPGFGPAGIAPAMTRSAPGRWKSGQLAGEESAGEARGGRRGGGWLEQVPFAVAVSFSSIARRHKSTARGAAGAGGRGSHEPSSPGAAALRSPCLGTPHSAVGGSLRATPSRFPPY